MIRHTFQIGQTVKVGKGEHVWTITGFFGEFGDIASLTRADLPSSNSSANITRLVEVTP